MKVMDGKISPMDYVNDSTGAQKEIDDQRKGKNIQILGKESIQIPEFVGKGNVMEGKFDKYFMEDITEKVSKEIPIILENGKHSGKDMETTNLQNLVINDFSQAKEFPNEKIPAADIGETLVENPMEPLEPPTCTYPMEGLCQWKEQCFSTFLVEHHYTYREGGEVSLDDERGLARSKESPDKGFYSDNDIAYHIDVDSHDSDFDEGIHEQFQATIHPGSN
ncbi:unnamed protein product [Ilex paraguariensis]|uniref:Uncharacterized protein n=1 Tax=Ilex paraguariensis TaxID=185542 RepID=A0ABC8SZY2_9AQUA